MDPEFCYPTGSGSTPDPDMSEPAEPDHTHLDPAEPDPTHLDPAGSGSKPRFLSTTGEKITLSAPQLEETGMTVYPVLCLNFYSSDN